MALLQTRREFLAAAAAAALPKLPNVLFLFTDDQRADTISALGNPLIQTPALDSLARTGVAFNNCYCLGSNMPAVCTPSRNMLLSGRVYTRYPAFAEGNRPNLADAMNALGYATYHYGKSGNVAREINKRFEVSKYLANDEAERRQGEPGRAIVDDAISYLRDRKDQRPFFMYLAFANPHDPRVAAEAYMNRYKPDSIPLPKNFLPEHPFDNGELKVRDELLAPFPRTEEEIRKQLREYYATITALDSHIGRLLQYLDETRLRENTLILFAADNGLALGSHGLMGKQNLYEHSTKVPMLWSGPGIRPGRSDALVYLMDIYPTLMDYLDGSIPDGLDGVSFRKSLGRPGAGARKDLVFAYRDVQRAIRDKRYKLIYYPKAGKTQFFDLKNDPDEMKDLSTKPGQQGRIRTMRARAAVEFARLGIDAGMTGT